MPNRLGKALDLLVLCFYGRRRDFLGLGFLAFCDFGWVGLVFFLRHVALIIGDDEGGERQGYDVI